MSERRCSVEGCERLVGKKSAKGLCSRHYQRWLRHGDDFKRGYIRAEKGQGEAFLKANVGYSGEGCLIWPFGRNGHGYAQARVNGHHNLASRLMCILAHGEPPFPEAQAAHSCGRGHEGCVAPNHLRWATVSENNVEKRDHGTMVQGIDCNFSKLTDEQVKNILADNRYQFQIAAEYGITQSAVSHIKLGKVWTHVTKQNRISGKSGTRGDRHRSAKLTNLQALAIYKDPRSARQIASEYGCALRTVHFIKSGARWSSITGHKRKA